MTPNIRVREKMGTKFELVEFRAQTDNIASHLENVSLSATYMSRTIRNQLINVIGDYLRKDTEIKKTKYCFILCEEVISCSHKEQLSLAIRLEDNHTLIREDFLDFIEVE